MSSKERTLAMLRFLELNSHAHLVTYSIDSNEPVMAHYFLANRVIIATPEPLTPDLRVHEERIRARFLLEEIRRLIDSKPLPELP